MCICPILFHVIPSKDETSGTTNLFVSDRHKILYFVDTPVCLFVYSVWSILVQILQCDKRFNINNISNSRLMWFHSTHNKPPYFSIRVSIRKNFGAIFAKESENFCFRCATFLRKKVALCAIIRKRHFAQKYAILLLRYSVLRTVSE